MSDYIPKIMKGGAELTSPSLIASVILTNNTINQQEATRQSHEADREFAETQRDSAESARVSDELTRESNEETRVADEVTRQDYYNAYKVLVNYNSSTAYIVGNKVTYQGGTYQCITNTTGNSPTYNTDNTWWKCIAAKGTDGAGGDMFKSTYDPNNKNTDAFNSANQTYDNATSGLTATNAQTAIDELKSETGDLESLSTTNKSNLVSAVNELRSDQSNYYTKTQTDDINKSFVIKGNSYINVKYPHAPLVGAKGDGVTDDTSAIQNAINYIVTIGGGVLYFPFGTYYITDQININNGNIGILGSGRMLTKIRVAGGSISAFVFSGTSGSPISSNFIYGMFIYHDSTAAGGYGISLSYTSVFKIKDIQVADFAVGLGMYKATNTLLDNVISSCSSGSFNHIGFDIINGCVSSVFRSCWVDTYGNTGDTIGFKATGDMVHDMTWENCETAGCAYGFYLDGHLDLYACDLHIKNPIIDAFSKQGVYIVGFSQDSSITIHDGWFNPKNVDAETDAILIDSSRGISISGGVQFMSDSNWDYSWGVKVVNGSSNVSIIGCQFTAQRRGVYLLDCTGCLISGNIFKSRVGQPAYMIIYTQNTTLSSITNNILDGYADYGIYCDTGSNNDIIIGNVISATNIGTELTSLGTGCVTTPNIVA